MLEIQVKEIFILVLRERERFSGILVFCVKITLRLKMRNFVFAMTENC